MRTVLKTNKQNKETDIKNSDFIKCKSKERQTKRQHWCLFSITLQLETIAEDFFGWACGVDNFPTPDRSSAQFGVNPEGDINTSHDMDVNAMINYF